MRRVKAFDRTQSLCEIYSVGFQLSFVSENLEQCHPWVLCKDYLTDALWATFNTERAHIYGFEYDPSEMPLISLDPVRIIVRNKQLNDDEFDRRIQNCCKFINLVDVKLKFNLSEIEKVEFSQGGNVWMFTLDKRWIHAPPLISMLSLFMRVGMFYNGKSRLHDAIRMFKKGVEAGRRPEPQRDDYDNEMDYWDAHADWEDDYCDDEEAEGNDMGYLRQSRSMRLLILKKGIKIFKPKMEENYPGDADIHTVHNNWGIVGAKNYAPFKTLWDLEGIDTIGKKKTGKKKKKVGKKKVAKKTTVK